MDGEAWKAYEELQHQHDEYLNRCLDTAQKNMKVVVQLLEKTEKVKIRLEQKKDKFKQELSDSKNEHSRLKRHLSKVNQHCEMLEKKLSNLSPKNMKKRMKTRENNIEKLGQENEKLKQENANLKEQNVNLTACNNDLEREKHRLNQKIRRLESKVADCQEGSEKIKNLQKQDRGKNKEIAFLENEVEEIMEKEEEAIQTFENGRYTDDVRVAVYELLGMGVGANKVSKIIRTVLECVGKMNVNRLPKATVIKYMATEQGMLAKGAAQKAIEDSTDDITLHVDGTSKKRKHFISYLASTSSGTFAMGLDDIHSETSEEVLRKAEESLNGLTELLGNSDEVNKVKVEEMLGRIKNVMTDRAAVNKAFIRKFEDWRAEVLPKVYPNFSSLSESVQKELTEVNALFCGKHLVLNLQEYAQKALYDWEEAEANGCKLGREKHIPWNRGNESATMLAVRSFCNCYGPDADPQSEYSFEFIVHLEDKYQERSHLQEFRGNRFNIPFENSTATYFHIPHMKTLVNSYSEQEQNRLVKSCRWDMEEDIILAGIRAMGMIERQLTSPLMQMLDSNIHIMDTSSYYTRLFEKVKQMMIDPTEILHGQTLLFADFPPDKDKLWDALFKLVSSEQEDLTKQAVIIIAHSLFLCMKRQVSDHLPGGKYHQPPERLRKETRTAPKHNLAPEWLFSHLDRKQREMPNANTLTMEGVILWTMNDTLSYLDSLEDSESHTLIERSIQNRKAALEAYRKKRDEIRRKVAH